jgi:hypothetical protein
MNIPARVKSKTADTLIAIEKLVISRLAKSIVEIIPKIRKIIAKKDKTVVPRQPLQFFIKLLPFQPGAPTLRLAKRSATQARTTAQGQI